MSSHHQIIICFLVCLLIQNSLTQEITPKAYPLYKQCGSSWSNDTMGANGATICSVGCLMSSVSMALHGFGIEINGQAANPGTLNAWLKSNNGYDSQSDLEEAVLPNINENQIQWVGRADTMNRTTVISNLDSDKTVIIANVMNGGHFVLVTGYDKTDENYYYVNDPGFSRTTYNTTEIVGWRIFNMASSAEFMTRMKETLRLRRAE